MRPSAIGIDQGTTGTRVVAFDEAWRPTAQAYRPVASRHPRPGWVEKDAEAVVQSVREALGEAAGPGPTDAVVGLDNEGETVLAWDSRSLAPLSPAIVWSCRRSQPIVERLRAQGVEERVRQLAGTPLDPYFSSTKIRWLLENDPATRDAAQLGHARFGTLDAYLCARLGDGARTDPSTAARTQLQRLDRPGVWDPELCQIFGVDPETLPPIGPSTGSLGTLCGRPLHSMLVDQTAALAGHGCSRAGDAKATYGTGIFVLAHAGREPPAGIHGLLPTVAWTRAEGVDYALDGGVFSAGSVIDWLRDRLGLIDSAAQTEELARSIPDSAGVRFLPALTGLGAPWWRPHARAQFAGLTAHATRAHLVRAALEALCLRVRDIIEAMAGAGVRPELLRVDGGMTANRWLMQRQADTLGIPVLISPTTEATALGAAAMAAVGAGRIGIDELAALATSGDTVEPSAESADWRDGEHEDWRRFVEAATSTAIA